MFQRGVMPSRQAPSAISVAAVSSSKAKVTRPPACAPSTKRVTPIGFAAVEARPEPLRPLLGGAVGERLRVDVAGRLLLDAVVADGGGRGQSLLEVAGLQLLALVGRVGPHAGEAVGLQL